MRRSTPIAGPAALLLAALAVSGCGGTRSADAPSAGSSAYVATPENRAPARRHRVHTVVKGDTLYSLSRRYSVEVAALRSANGLGANAALSIGQQLRIPGGGPGGSGRPMVLNPHEAARRANQAAAALGPQRIHRPVPGEIVRKFGEGFGRRKNAGVDLGAEAGAEVVAAADGKVAFVSDPTSPVGAVVLMQHSGGMTTIYGRLTDIEVRPGQQLRAGQPLARVAPRHGDRPALHFEIRYGSEPVNPTPFL